MLDRMLEEPTWKTQHDGSRVRLSNGIRIVDRTVSPPAERDRIAHLVTWQDELDQMVVLGLDEACRPVYTATLYAFH